MKNKPNIFDVKRFWNTRPCNIKHSSSKIGTKKYFNEVEKRKYFVEPHIPKFADFKKWKNKQVLEIGCGIGTDTVNFLRNGAKVTAVELSDESLKIAKQRVELFGLDNNINFISCNAEQLNKYINKKKFDLVYSFGVIHHTVNPRKIIKAIVPLMKKNSELRIMLYAKNSWKNFMIEYGYDQPEAQYGCPIAKTYTPSQVNLLLKEFSKIEIEQDHIFPYIVSDYKKYKYTIQPYFKAMGKKLFNDFQKKFGWHLLIKAKL